MRLVVYLRVSTVPVPTEQVALRMRASGEPVPEIAKIIGVSTPTMYRLLAERSKEAV